MGAWILHAGSPDNTNLVYGIKPQANHGQKDPISKECGRISINTVPDCNWITSPFPNIVPD